MTAKERREADRTAARRVAEAFALLPPDRKVWFVGWAEGVIDATHGLRERKEDRAG